ncbi:MAG: family 10 glycosylhydrolase [Saprospiraceae bacterium]|nr:family 10 glycosylhydrolase [Saprospiraceae bacterium]
MTKRENLKRKNIGIVLFSHKIKSLSDEKSNNFFSFFLLCATMIGAQNAPKREMRAAWITTVSNLDWPTSKTLTPAAQRQQLIDILDKHKEAGLNAVLLQIRTNSDAFYPSQLAPWADWLTGLQGKAPEPFYDPLEFAIAECRKRGLEFHAWFNPYRAVANINTAVLADSHVVKKHPEWLLAFGNARILDPGLPDVRNHVTKVVMEVVRRYDIDGVHFDDFFYPYPSTGLSFNDDATFAQHSRNFSDRNNWRRDNVDLLIKWSLIVSKRLNLGSNLAFRLSEFGKINQPLNH